MRYPIWTLAVLLAATPAAAGETVFTPSLTYRPRAEVDHRYGDAANFFVSHRARAGLTAAQDEWSARLEAQDVRTWGTEPNTLAHKANVDMHQAYVRYDAAPGLRLTAGRQEIVYLNQRLVGAVDWSQVGRSFDALRAGGSVAHVTWDAFAAVTSDAVGKGNSDQSAYGGLLAWDNAGRKVAVVGVADRYEAAKLKRYTFGPYSEGKIVGPLTYRLEAYLQKGERGPVDLNGFLYSGEVGYAGGPLKAYVGYDRVSGGDKDYTAFDTLFATNHKFYGAMDLFVALPKDTGGAGLQDAYAAVQGKAGDASASLTVHRFNAERPADVYFGTETDLIVGYAFSKRAQLQAGYGVLVAGEAFRAMHAQAPDHPNWGYSMLTASF